MSAGGVYGNSMPTGMYGMNMNSNNMVQGNYDVIDQGKGKGKFKEADFEAAFAQAAASFSPAQVETSRFVEVDDSVTNVEEALKNATLNDHKEGMGQFKE